LGREMYTEHEWYELSHILIVPAGGMAQADNEAKGEARSMATQVLRECNNDPSCFEDKVKELSADEKTKGIGGKLGACHDEPLNPEIPDEIFIHQQVKQANIGRGQFTPVFATARGYHIVRVDAVHPQRIPDFREVRSRIEYDYIRAQAKLTTDIWLRELVRHSRIKRFMFEEMGKKSDDLPEDNFHLPKGEN